MPLVNLTMLSSSRSHITWTVIQVEDGLTFVTLFQSIIAGSHPRLHVDELLSRSTLEKVFVGHSKEAMSVVDELLGVNDVCSLFGSHIKYVVRLQSGAVSCSHCCQLRQYTFCIKKCGRLGCKVCKPVRMEKETFEKLKFLPDPQMQDDGHYLPFQEAFALNTTTEQDRPSQKGKRKASPLSFSPSVQHARNTDIMVQCDECSMWRLLFSKHKLSAAERATLQVVLEDISYTCGASLDELDLPDRLSTVVIRNHQCGDAIERLYYSAGYEDICIYCATTSNLVQSLQDSYPICSSCHDTHQPVKKRQR